MFAPKRNENPMHYWISFWPVAPLFGVPWRFEAMIPTASFFRPGTVAAKMSEASANEAARVVEEAATATEAAADAATAVVESVAATPAAAPATPAPAPAAPDVEDAETVTVAPATLYASAPAQVDDLKLIKGVGPKMEEMLNDMGIYTFAQIAGFTPENLAWVDDNLTSFKGRPLRDDWIAQAKGLMG